MVREYQASTTLLQSGRIVPSYGEGCVGDAEVFDRDSHPCARRHTVSLSEDSYDGMLPDACAIADEILATMNSVSVCWQRIDTA